MSCSTVHAVGYYAVHVVCRHKRIQLGLIMFCRFIAGHRYLDDLKSLNIIIFRVAKQTHNKTQKTEITILNLI